MEGAGAVFIEPREKVLVLTQLVGRSVTEMMRMPYYMDAPIRARIKSMADLLVGISSVPQQGRLTVRFDGRDYDLQVSFTPVGDSEKVDIRIRPRQQVAA